MHRFARTERLTATHGKCRTMVQTRRQSPRCSRKNPKVNASPNREAEESTARYLSYYDNDLVVTTGMRLLIDEPRDFDETLYIMELREPQLRRNSKPTTGCWMTRWKRSSLSREQLPVRAAIFLRELREIRIDMARFNDELSNTTRSSATGILPASTKRFPRAFT